MAHSDDDIAMMRIALRMARRGLGTTAPNPSVGAVITDPDTGEVIARGWTQPGGRPHAETEAIRRAGPRARGATLYSTLEPCSHHGKTPPCADAIIKAGIARVVAGVLDPNAVVAGQGYARLRAAGVEVTTGVCEAEARHLTLGHIRRVTSRRPFVRLKVAVDADGFVPRGTAGRPLWISSPEARARAHLLRAESDAILVGRGTVVADNPELTCRLPGLEHRSPLRVILASHLDIPVACTLIATARSRRTTVLCLHDAPEDREAALVAAGATVVRTAASSTGRLDLAAVLQHLSEAGITRVLVEGGTTVLGGFLDRLADELVVVQSSDRLPPAVRLRPFGDRMIGDLGRLGWETAERHRVGPDTLTIYRPKS